MSPPSTPRWGLSSLPLPRVQPHAPREAEKSPEVVPGEREDPSPPSAPSAGTRPSLLTQQARQPLWRHHHAAPRPQQRLSQAGHRPLGQAGRGWPGAGHSRGGVRRAGTRALPQLQHCVSQQPLLCSASSPCTRSRKPLPRSTWHWPNCSLLPVTAPRPATHPPRPQGVPERSCARTGRQPGCSPTHPEAQSPR